MDPSFSMPKDKSKDTGPQHHEEVPIHAGEQITFVCPRDEDKFSCCAEFTINRLVDISRQLFTQEYLSL
jgi:hypothetical protein